MTRMGNDISRCPQSCKCACEADGMSDVMSLRRCRCVCSSWDNLDAAGRVLPHGGADDGDASPNKPGRRANAVGRLPPPLEPEKRDNSTSVSGSDVFVDKQTERPRRVASPNNPGRRASSRDKSTSVSGSDVLVDKRAEKPGLFAGAMRRLFRRRNAKYTP